MFEFFGNFRKLTVSWYAPRAGESLAWDIWILNNFQEFWVFWNFVNFLRCYRKVRKLNPRALFCYLNVSESLVQVCPLRCLESTSVRVFSATFVGRYGSCYISLIATFLVACTRLFTLFRPLVGPSVGPSVRRCWPGARDLWRLALFIYCTVTQRFLFLAYARKFACRRCNGLGHSVIYILVKWMAWLQPWQFPPPLLPFFPGLF